MNFPAKCPYCGKDNVPKVTQQEYELGTICPLKIEIHHCIHCKKTIFAIRQSGFDEYNRHCDGEYIFVYPTTTTVPLSKRIKELSPNAFGIYYQVSQAKSIGCDALVRGGIRIALEYLLFDYLVKLKNYDADTVSKMPLIKRCEEYCNDKKSDKYSQNIVDTCTRLVRLVGNEVIHGKEPLPFDTKEVQEAFELLCKFIDLELQMESISNRLPPKTTP